MGTQLRRGLGTFALATVVAALGAGTAEAVPAHPGLPIVPVAETDGLTPALKSAYNRAKADAARAGITLTINSGFRTRAQQQQFWNDALRQYGSAAKARQFVMPPGQSAHERGQAIDVGPRAGAQWLENNGARYGLCRRYLNEWWHFELATSPGGRCPALLPNAAG